MESMEKIRSLIINDPKEICAVKNVDYIIFYALNNRTMEKFSKDFKNESTAIFRTIYGFKKTDVLIYGDTSTFKEKLIPLIPSNLLGTWLAKRTRNSSHLRMTYKCFRPESIDRWHFLGPFITTVIHPTPESSWACIVECLNWPKTGLVLNIRNNLEQINLKYQVKVNDNHRNISDKILQRLE